MAKKKPTPSILTEREQRFLKSYDITEDTPIQFFTRQPSLLLVYMMLSLGAYALYWMYRNWDAVRVASGQKMWPFWRALFAVIYVWPLFKIMILQARVRGYNLPYSGGLLALAYVLPPVAASFLPHHHMYDDTFLIARIVISVLSVFVFLLAQQAVIWNNPRKRNRSYDVTTPTEMIYIAVLCILPMLIVTTNRH